MTDLSRRDLFKAGGLAACAAALPAAHAAQKKTSGGPDLAATRRPVRPERALRPRPERCRPRTSR